MKLEHLVIISIFSVGLAEDVAEQVEEKSIVKKAHSCVVESGTG